MDAGGDDSASETATGGVAEDSQGDAAGGDTETRELASPGTAPGPDDGAESAAPELPTEIPAQPLRPGTFKRDAEAARVNGSAMTESLRRPVDCGDLPTGAVQLVPVTYDGSLGYLAFDPPEADGQRVALYLCPAGELVREAVLPAP